MGSDHMLRGRVESVAADTEDRDRSAGAILLVNVNPTFNWVRLAQRIPVCVMVDSASERNELVAGTTATMEVLGSSHASVDGPKAHKPLLRAAIEVLSRVRLRARSASPWVRITPEPFDGS